jgi:hypothetical protein
MTSVTETNEPWTDAQLSTFADQDELVVVVHRAELDTKRVPIWLVVVDGAVYVRSYKGVGSMWFRRVQADFRQDIELGSDDVPVTFENVDRTNRVNAAISAEFARKYARFDYVSAMSEPAAVEATLRILSR